MYLYEKSDKKIEGIKTAKEKSEIKYDNRLTSTPDKMKTRSEDISGNISTSVLSGFTHTSGIVQRHVRFNNISNPGNFTKEELGTVEQCAVVSSLARLEKLVGNVSQPLIQWIRGEAKDADDPLREVDINCLISFLDNLLLPEYEISIDCEKKAVKTSRNKVIEVLKEELKPEIGDIRRKSYMLTRERKSQDIPDTILECKRCSRRYKGNNYSNGGLIYNALSADPNPIIAAGSPPIRIGHQTGDCEKEFVFFVNGVPYAFAKAEHVDANHYRITECFLAGISVGKIIELDGGDIYMGTGVVRREVKL